MTTQATEDLERARTVGQMLGALLGEMMQASAQDMLRLLQREDLSMPRMAALLMLHRCSAATISDISRHLNLSLAATSQLIDKLVDGGLVTRREHPHDRRHKHVTLTESGLAIAEEVQRLRVEELSRRLAELPPPLLDTAHAVLSDVLAHLRASRRTPPPIDQ